MYVEDSKRPVRARALDASLRSRRRHAPAPRGRLPRARALGWRAFQPVPPDKACTEIFGGPQVAIVSGRVDGRRVWARLSRVDGCQIARWERVPSLLPAGGAR